MDKLSVVGILIGLMAIYVGFTLDGGAISALFALPAFIIVIGGTVGAVVLQSSAQEFFHALTLIKWVFIPPHYDIDEGIENITFWAGKSRGSGYLSLEDIALDEEDTFISKALNLLVDGVNVEELNETLSLELELYREHNLRAANIFEAMGGYSPTIGILGAVLGLINAMNHLATPELLGHGISTAFVATIYGVGFANLLFLPVANKIRSIIHHQTLYREMICEGIASIAEGESPLSIKNKLSAYRLRSL
ncbi:MAG: flagellar motor protein [Colwellia sp.]